MNTAVDFALPALFVIVVWWSSTGAIFYLNGLGEETYRRSLFGVAVLATLSGYALVATRDDPGPAEAAIAFVAAVAIWGLIEMSFLMGFVTGPRRAPCPAESTGWHRFKFASLAIAYHELAIVLALALIYWFTSNAANFVGFVTFSLLWLMRLSTKLNIFFGVPNTASELLPARIAYLKSYFRTGPMSGLFPLSVTIATILPCVFAMRAGAASATNFEVTGYSLLAALSALGVIEHWFLVLQLPTQALWGWSLAALGTPLPKPDRLSADPLLCQPPSTMGRSPER